MKPFNFGKPKASKWFLVSGLMIALGASLSWNPQNTQIARYESPVHYKTTEFASEASGELKKFNLKERNSRDCNADVQYFLDKSTSGDKQKVRFLMEGEVCSDCDNEGSVIIGNQNFEEDILSIQTVIAEAARKLCAKPTPESASDKEDKESKEEDPAIAEVDLNCTDAETEDEFQDCSDAITSLADTCDNEDLGKAEKRECKKKVTRAFNSYVKPLLRKGLMSSMNSEEYNSAALLRSELMEGLPSAFDQSIREDLVTLTAFGVAARAVNTYQACQSGASFCPPGTDPSLMAKAQLNDQTQLERAALVSSMRSYWSFGDYGWSELNQKQTEFNQQLMTKFQTPLNSIFYDQNQSHGWDMAALEDKMFASMMGGDPNAINASGNTEAVAGPRNNFRAIEIDPTIFNPFGTPSNSGSPALMNGNSIELPRANLRNPGSISSTVPMARPGT